MRIGVAYLEYSRKKGIERIFSEIADRVAQAGHEVHCHCTKWEDSSSSLVQFHRVSTVDFFNSTKLFSFAFSAKASLKSGHYDITHSYGNVVGCDVITAQSCHRAGMEAARTLFPVNFRTGTNFGIADRLRLRIEQSNYGRRQYRKVIACSTLVKRELTHHYGVPEKDIVVIPNGVDVDNFHPRNRKYFFDSIRITHNIKKEDLVLLFVGHEFGRKGLKTVIESLALLKEKHIKLLVCGGDRPDKYLNLAKKLGVEKRIFFVGPQSNINEYYAAADIFVLPTLHEAFGLVITEAMASGLPVVVARQAGAAEDIIEDGKDGVLLSDPLNSEELAGKITYLEENTAYRAKVGAQAHQKMQNFTWDHCVQKVLEVYEEVRHTKTS